MPNIEIQAVESRRDQKAFLQLPWSIYRDDPHWVPPLLMDFKRLLNFSHHPFYDDAKIATFLARRDGEVVGRIAAIVNHAHNRKYQEKRGFFGFFESIDDQAVADALFGAARRWLTAEGMTCVRGPANPSLNYECGLLVECFDQMPTFMMTYNRPYYGRLIEAAGLARSQDLLAFWGKMDMLATLDPKLFFIATQAMERLNVKVRPMNTKKFTEELQMFLHIYNDSMLGTWGFVPLSSSEIKVLGEGLKHLIVPELAIVAEVDGKPIGASFGLLDYNPRIRKIGGRLFPFGFIKLLRNKRSIKKIRIISTNVVQEYQRWGVGLILMGHFVEPMQRFGVQEVEFSWVLESNHLSRASLERGGAILQKRYRMYDQDFAAS